MKLVTLIEKRDIFIEKSLSIEMTKVGQEFIFFFQNVSVRHNYYPRKNGMF